MSEPHSDAFSAVNQGLAQLWASMWPGALAAKPTTAWPAGMEAAFGGVADALGLGPSRRMAAATLALGEAQTRQNAAWLALLQLVAQRWPELVQRGLRGVWMPGEGTVAPGSMAEVLSLWASLADETAHDALHGRKGAEAMANCIREATAVQTARNQFSEALCESLNLPSRAEMDQAYLEIQLLKRQLRRAAAPVVPRQPAVKQAASKTPGRRSK